MSQHVDIHANGTTLCCLWLLLQAAADQYVVPNAFGSILQQAGAVGLNAATSHDFTRYFMALPSNKLELWFALEAERFQVPVFRWVMHDDGIMTS